MNLEKFKGYYLDAIWSQFNLDITSRKLQSDFCFLHIFLMFFLLFSQIDFDSEETMNANVCTENKRVTTKPRVSKSQTLHELKQSFVGTPMLDYIVSDALRSIKVQSIFPSQYIYDNNNEENAALLKVSSSVSSSGGRTLRPRIFEDK